MKKTFVAIAIFIYTTPVFAQTKTPASKPSAERGKLVYQQVCLTCHQADGGGVPNMNPPLIRSAWVAGDKKRLINLVLKGFSEKVAINGAYFNNNMPAQSTLTDQQIADVLTYIRSNFGNKTGAIAFKDVAAQRKIK